MGHSLTWLLGESEAVYKYTNLDSFVCEISSTGTKVLHIAFTLKTEVVITTVKYAVKIVSSQGVSITYEPEIVK